MAAVTVRTKSEKKEFVKSIKSRLTVSQVMRMFVFYYNRSFAARNGQLYFGSDLCRL